MNQPVPDSAADFAWPREGVTRAPYQVYLDPAIYQREQARIFRGPTWNYLGLAVELAQAGDYKTTFVGDTPVVVTRDADGFHAFVNRCAHRGATLCMETQGHCKNKIITCVYHSWVYDLKGNLKGLPFQKGVDGQGGMPADFKLAEHGLQKLRVEAYDGLIFGSFDARAPALTEYLGDTMRGYLDRLFTKPLRILGYNRQLLHNNWKLYIENNKDPYHASLLHLFFATFGLNRLSQKGGIDLDASGKHHVSYTHGAGNENAGAYEDTEMRSFQSKYQLHDPSLLKSRREFADGIALAIQSLFPTLVVQQIYNVLALRQLLPKGPGACELVWTYFGYHDDDAEMTSIRMKQANLVGPAGYVSLEDGGVGELVQKTLVPADQTQATFMEMGGREVGSQPFRATETSVRGFWQEYRALMGF